jgi:hypothetical protein
METAENRKKIREEIIESFLISVNHDHFPKDDLTDNKLHEEEIFNMIMTLLEIRNSYIPEKYWDLNDKDCDDSCWKDFKKFKIQLAKHIKRFDENII